MGSLMILILSNSDDLHAIAIASKLRERGAQLAWLDHREYPSNARVSFRVVGGRSSPLLRTVGEDIDLGGLTAIWHRRPYDANPPEMGDAALWRAVHDDCDLFLRDLWNSIDCLTVPAPWAVYRRADFKASQLTQAVQVGLEIPDTLITNDPAEFLEFYRKHDGHIISKLASPVFNRDYLDGIGVRYTEVVSNRDVGYFKSVRNGPTIFQSYVPKKVELRVTVVGDMFFPAEIHSQTTRRTTHDWRHYDDLNTPVYPHVLPAEVEEKLRKMLRHFGLHFGAIDMIVTPDGRYVFLELNPNGQFLWIEELTGLPISDAMCDLLMSASAARRAGQPVPSEARSYDA
jgi:hypothetical protein